MPNVRKKRVPFSLIFWPGLAALVYGLDFFLQANTTAAEFYSRHIFGVLRQPFLFIHRVIPFSVTEFGAALLILTVIPGIIFWIIRLVRHQTKGSFTLRSVRFLVILFSIVYVMYMLFHGYNFSRQTLFKSLELPQREYSKEELYEVTAWLVSEVNASRELVETDDEGYFQITGDESRREAMRRAETTYDLIAETTELIHRGQSVPKPVFLSKQWSYTGTTGMYFPIFVESNVNRDVSPDEMLFTTLHELAHAQGFAREDECNYWAYYAGTRHPDEDYRYSAYLSTFVYFNNAVFTADRDIWGQIYDQLDDQAKQDLARRNLYWDQFKGPIKETSRQVNDTFLKVNHIEDGTKSYGRMMDLVMAEYFQNVQ